MNIRKVAAAFAVCVAATIGVLGVSAPAHAQDTSWGEVIAPHASDTSWGEIIAPHASDTSWGE